MPTVLEFQCSQWPLNLLVTVVELMWRGLNIHLKLYIIKFSEEKETNDFINTSKCACVCLDAAVSELELMHLQKVLSDV